jgi:hypothetical protein
MEICLEEPMEPATATVISAVCTSSVAALAIVGTIYNTQRQLQQQRDVTINERRWKERRDIYLELMVEADNAQRAGKKLDRDALDGSLRARYVTWGSIAVKNKEKEAGGILSDERVIDQILRELRSNADLFLMPPPKRKRRAD